MRFDLTRQDFTDKSTIGGMLADGKFLCYMLEPVDRQRNDQGLVAPWSSYMKITKKTAIPRGRYDIIVTKSNRFNTDLPLLLDVPDFECVRIHVGNYPHNTDGCLLPGKVKARDFVGLSAAQMEIFMKLMSTGNKHEIYIW